MVGLSVCPPWGPHRLSPAVVMLTGGALPLFKNRHDCKIHCGKTLLLKGGGMKYRGWENDTERKRRSLLFPSVYRVSLGSGVTNKYD